MQRDNKPESSNRCRLIPKNWGSPYSTEQDDRTQPRHILWRCRGTRGTKWRGEQKAIAYTSCWKNSVLYGCRAEAFRSLTHSYSETVHRMTGCFSLKPGRGSCGRFTLFERFYPISSSPPRIISLFINTKSSD